MSKITTAVQIIEGLKVLHKNAGDSLWIQGEHDVIYAGNGVTLDLPTEDVEFLISLGWHQEGGERNYDQEFSTKDFDPEESWVKYT